MSVLKWSTALHWMRIVALFLCTALPSLGHASAAPPSTSSDTSAHSRESDGPQEKLLESLMTAMALSIVKPFLAQIQRFILQNRRRRLYDELANINSQIRNISNIWNRSLTASLNFCLHPMYRSVVWTEA